MLVGLTIPYCSQSLPSQRIAANLAKLPELLGKTSAGG
jgi:hypothetical protein